MRPICPTCKQELAETPSGYWTCAAGHTKLVHERELGPYWDAANKLWREINRESIAKDEQRAEEWRAERERRRQKREEKKRALAELPFAHRTALHPYFRIENHDGLFLECDGRRSGTVHALSAWHKRDRFFRRATEAEVEEALAAEANYNEIPF